MNPLGWKKLNGELGKYTPSDADIKRALLFLQEMHEVIKTHPEWGASEDKKLTWWRRAMAIREKYENWK